MRDAIHLALLCAINICFVWLWGGCARVAIDKLLWRARHIKENDEFNMCISQTKCECGLVTGIATDKVAIGCMKRQRVGVRTRYSCTKWIFELAKICHESSECNNNNRKMHFGRAACATVAIPTSPTKRLGRELRKCAKDGNENVQMMSGNDFALQRLHGKDK